MPTGKVLTDVQYVADDAKLTAYAERYAPALSELTNNEIDTAARQNLYYNVHNPVIIE